MDGTESNDRQETSFTEIHGRLRRLELWHELGIRPSVEECHTDDRFMLELEHDDCELLSQKCLEVRATMNDNLPVYKTHFDGGLKPKVSQIPKSGNGLFYFPTEPSQVIPKGATICYYYGHIHNFHSSGRLEDKSYLMLVSGNVLVDPRPCLEIKARYINDPINPDLYNCCYEPEPLRFRCKVVALRDLRSGEELFASYGEAYWANQSTGAVFYKVKRQAQICPN